MSKTKQKTQKPAIYTCGARVTDAFNAVWLNVPDRTKRRITHWTKLPTSPPANVVYIVSSSRGLDDWGALNWRPQGVRPKYFVVDPHPTYEVIAPRIAKLRVGDEQRLHMATAKSSGQLRELLRRFVHGLSTLSPAETIFDAWWDEEMFVVMSPEFERLRIPLEFLPKKIQASSKAARSKFEVDEFGDFVYWPRLDVHMGWAQFEQAVDSQAKLRAEQKSARFNKRYGKAIRQLRDQHKLRQSDIQGLDARTIGRIERGVTRATANAIAKLAKAHGLGANEYMSNLAEALDES